MGDVTLAAFDWAPEMPRGCMRDLRARFSF